MSDDDFTTQIETNMKIWIEEMKNGSSAGNVATLNKFLMYINVGVAEKLKPIIVGVATGPVFRYNNVGCEVKTVRLTTRFDYTDDIKEKFDNDIENKILIDKIVNEITAEYNAIHSDGCLENFHPYMLAISGGVVIDPNNFTLVVPFLSRYYATKREET